MSSENWKTEKDLCRCCHSEGSFKNLAEPFKITELAEIYADMLKECYDIDMAPIPGMLSAMTYTICEVCIMRLRDASEFKKQVLSCEERFRDMYNRDVIKAVTSVEVEVKQELLDSEPDDDFKEDLSQDDNDDEDYDESMDLNINEEADEKPVQVEVRKKRKYKPKTSVKTPAVKSKRTKRKDLKQEPADTENDADTKQDGMGPLKEELLEIELHKKEEFETEIVLKIEYDNHADDVFNDDNENEIKSCEPKRNMVKRKITETKTKILRKSTKKCQDKVDKKTMKYINPRQNVALILEHSTVMPFKSRVGYFNCFYCNKQFAGFDLLKTHASELHENISYKCILKSIYRPHDRIRADVSDINCRICKKKIDGLDFLIQHLTDDHNVKFNFDSDTKKPADCILGYDLSEGRYRCCQCKEEFTFFKTLSNHMNEHSTDHVCDVCGRCFLLASRLRAHSESHKEKSIVKCDLCGKICGSKMLLQSHVRYKHQKLPFMCSICDKPFNTSQERVKHLEEVHNRAPLDLTCKICSKKFGHHINLYCHMKNHLNIKPERKFGCSVCDMKFSTNSGLSNHMVVHSGEKNYECEVCHKKYGRRKTLMEHLRIHKNDRRFACGACSQAFVQKCSLKNHIRVHHGVMDYEKLIVDKKSDAK